MILPGALRISAAKNSDPESGSRSQAFKIICKPFTSLPLTGKSAASAEAVFGCPDVTRAVKGGRSWWTSPPLVACGAGSWGGLAPATVLSTKPLLVSRRQSMDIYRYGPPMVSPVVAHAHFQVSILSQPPLGSRVANRRGWPEVPGRLRVAGRSRALRLNQHRAPCQSQEQCPHASMLALNCRCGGDDSTNSGLSSTTGAVLCP
jgi:hypothetical protein